LRLWPLEDGALGGRNAQRAAIRPRLGRGAKSTEAARKRGEFLRLAEQSEILRGFLDSERPEDSKKRTK
jgi:hypothetical protein